MEGKEIQSVYYNIILDGINNVFSGNKLILTKPAFMFKVKYVDYNGAGASTYNLKCSLTGDTICIFRNQSISLDLTYKTGWYRTTSISFTIIDVATGLAPNPAITGTISLILEFWE
jgi:hypothetical protein